MDQRPGILLFAWCAWNGLQFTEIRLYTSSIYYKVARFSMSLRDAHNIKWSECYGANVVTKVHRTALWCLYWLVIIVFSKRRKMFFIQKLHDFSTATPILSKCSALGARCGCEHILLCQQRRIGFPLFVFIREKIDCMHWAVYFDSIAACAQRDQADLLDG